MPRKHPIARTGDKIRTKVYKDIDAFIKEQTEIERTSATRRGQGWTYEDDRKMRGLKALFLHALEAARQDKEGYPKAVKQLAKITNMPGNEQWMIGYWVYASGEVEFVHKKIAERRHLSAMPGEML